MSSLVERAVAELRAAAPDGLLVGGCVRDWLLDRPIKDLDVAIPDSIPDAFGTGEAPETIGTPTMDRVRLVGRQVAGAMGGSFFWLREGMGVARVVLPGEPGLQIDVVPLAGSLETDLRRRDFTINAMAVRVADGFQDRAAVIDPTGGRADLAECRLRLAASDALEQDPLRCLRAFRFRATLGFRFGAGTEAALRAAAPGLARVSGERIRDELFVLLESPVTTEVVGELLAHDLISPWSPALAASARGAPSKAEGVASPATGLAVARELDRWLSSRPAGPAVHDNLERTLSRAITPPRSRRALLRFATLASNAGPQVSEIARILALSSDESRILVRGVAGAAALEAAWPLPGRGRLRFWQQWEPGAVEAVLLTIARAEARGRAARIGTERGQGQGMIATEQPTSVEEALLADLLERRLRPRAPLLTGGDVMAILGLAPGPEVGRWLQQIEELRADGKIGTTDEARVWLQGQRRDAPVHPSE